MPYMVWHQQQQLGVGRVLHFDRLTLFPGQSWFVAIDWRDSLAGNIAEANVQGGGVSVSDVAFDKQTVTFRVMVERYRAEGPRAIDCEIVDQRGRRQSCVFPLPIDDGVTCRVDTEAADAIAPKYIGLTPARTPGRSHRESLGE